jgi:hypothetical protein
MPTTKGTLVDAKPQPTAVAEDRRFSVLCQFAVFLSAFLLFQVELIIGKFVLPWFGGAPATWVTCLLFFQVMLLLGYSYAHAMMRRRVRVQAAVHIALIAVSLISLAITTVSWRTPITPGAAWKPVELAHPTWQVLQLLAISVGIPFLLLSSTTPLVQSWFERAQSGRSAYPLYAVSNFGSLLGLLSYPLLIEPNSTLFLQGWAWSIGYCSFALACAACALTVRRAQNREVATAPTTVAIPRFTYALWILLPACGSAMLLAATNVICQEVAVVPLLWVLPLALYLMSFILCFARRNLCRRWIFHPMFAMAAILVLVANRGSLLIEISAYLLLLFSVCMSCHGELVRLQPPASKSTAFYLSIATGGALGSIFVSVIAPQIFTGLWELPVSLIASGIVITAALFYDRQSWLYRSPVWLPVALVWGLILYFRGVASAYDLAPAWRIFPFVFMVLLTLVLLRLIRRSSDRLLWGWFRPVQFFFVALIGMLAYFSIGQMRTFFRTSLYASRNFFGVLRVTPGPGTLQLSHGRTFHGSQVTDPQHKDEPTAYYLPESGIGILFREYPKRATGPLRVGLVGLGVGTLAAYGRAGDEYVFYDINPAVYKLSAAPGARFTFVADSPAKSIVRIGDARLLMEAEVAHGEPQNFDILVLDAFNSDAIPVHLLTREAVKLYLAHLNPDGVLAFHISNRSLDLAPVLTGLMNEFHLECADVDYNQPPIQASRWVLMSRNRAMLETPTLKKQALYGAPSDRSELWTDDYSNLLRLIKWPKWM